MPYYSTESYSNWRDPSNANSNDFSNIVDSK